MRYTAFLISLQFFLNGFTLTSSHLILFSSLSSNYFLLLFHLGHCLAVCSSFKSSLWSLLSFTKQCFSAIFPLLFIGHYTGRYLPSPGVCSELLLIHMRPGFRPRASGQVELNSSQANFQCDFHCNIVLLKANLQPLLPRLSEALNDGGLKQYSNPQETQL